MRTFSSQTQSPVGAVVLAAIAGLASAQGTVNPYAPNPANASRLLQVEPSPIPGGNYVRPDLGREVAFRNAIVTGNAPGGVSFRGDAGYTAPNDFRSDLGSDSTFNFRRDSFASGLGGLGLRGTDALQYQFAFTTGNSAGLSRSARTSITPGSATSIRDELLGIASSDSNQSWLLRRGGWTQTGPDFGTMRSTASYAGTRGLNPAIIAARPTALGVEQIVASPLLGMRVDLTGKAWYQKQQPGAANPAGAVPGVPSAPGAGVPGAPNTQAPTTPATTPSTQEAAQPGGARTAYEDLRLKLSALPDQTRPEQAVPPAPSAQKPADRATTPGAKPQEPETKPWESWMDRLRDSLDTSPRGSINRRPTEAGAKPADTTPGLTPTAEPPGDQSPDKTKPDPRKSRGWLDDESLRILRESAGNVGKYVEGEARDYFGEHMLAGQKLMGEERYFDAEERFARALSFKPGEPSAMAGRVNAELGAGMLVSAAVNLRDLYRRHPEVIGVRYQGATMPSEERLQKLLGSLRETIAAPKARGSIHREAALLLAYLGYQGGDEKTAREGLDYLRADDARTAAPEDRVLTLLCEVWLKPPAPSGGEEKKPEATEVGK